MSVSIDVKSKLNFWQIRKEGLLNKYWMVNRVIRTDSQFLIDLELASFRPVLCYGLIYL